MAEIVNLRLARKRAARGAQEKEAAENRTRFGRTGGEKKRDRIEAEREIRRLDGHRRDVTDSKDG